MLKTLISLQFYLHIRRRLKCELKLVYHDLRLFGLIGRGVGLVFYFDEVHLT
jgi:hypothetical protein